jgi:hypothetical protein
MKESIYNKVASECRTLIFSKIFPLSLQIHFVAGLFGLETDAAIKFAKTLPTDPNEGECYFAFPRISSVAKSNFPTIEDPQKQYFATIDMLFKLFKKHIGLQNENEMLLWDLTQGEQTGYRQEEKTRNAIKLIEEKQQGDILIISVQFGCLRVDQSVEQVRKELEPNEFGLDMLMLGLALFMHPYYVRDGYPTFLAVGENAHDGHVPSFRYHYMESKYEHLRIAHIKFCTAPITYKKDTTPCTGYIL